MEDAFFVYEKAICSKIVPSEEIIELVANDTISQFVLERSLQSRREETKK